MRDLPSTSKFIDENGDLKIEQVLNKIQELMKEEYSNKTEEFIEREGRLLFLALTKPIINGIGFYFVEAQTRDNQRLDLGITINKKQYIIELKKW
jgi:aspartyl aminopeptidase